MCCWSKTYPQSTVSLLGSNRRYCFCWKTRTKCLCSGVNLCWTIKWKAESSVQGSGVLIMQMWILSHNKHILISLPLCHKNVVTWHDDSNLSIWLSHLWVIRFSTPLLSVCWKDAMLGEKLFLSSQNNDINQQENKIKICYPQSVR